MSEITTPNPRIQDATTLELYEFRLEDGVFKLSPVSQSSTSADIQVSANWPAVNMYTDGQDVNAEVLNKPIGELASRTTYLYQKLQMFDRDNPLAAVVVSGVALSNVDTPDVGDIVYLDASDKKYKKALATADLYDQFLAAGSAFAVGILTEKGGTRGSVAMFGRVKISDQAFNLKTMVEDGEEFRDGLYYLSGRQAGKLTADPPGPRVVVGQFFRSATSQTDRIDGDYALIHVESKSLAEAHVHRSFVLKGLPAGEQAITEDSPDGFHVYQGYSPDDLVFDPGDNYYENAYTPRLVFTGEWLKEGNCKYTFTLVGYVGVGSETPNELDFSNDARVIVHCENETTGFTKDLEFSSFRQPEEVEYGMRVELRPDPKLDDSSTLVYRSSDTTKLRTWSYGMTFPEAGRGWRDLTEDEKSRFGDNKPKFVYNSGFDRSMQTYYPPIPLESASLVMNGVELTAKGSGKPYTYSIEPDSLYWWDDRWDHAPWPVDYNGRGAVEEREERRIVLHMIKASTAETGPVTSLTAKPGSGIRVLRCGSDTDSNVGDLELDFDPTGNVEDVAMEGYKVVKGGSDGKFLMGPVVERIVAGAGIEVSRWGQDPQGQGTVVVSTKSSGVQGEFEEVALQNAKQDLVGMFPYIRLLGWNSNGTSNTNSAFILKFHVPYDNPDAVYKIHMSGSVFGTTSYTGGSARYAGLRMQYSILPDLTPGNGSSAAANVQDDLIGNDGLRPIEIPLVSVTDAVGSSYKAFDPVFVHTEGGTVSGSDAFGKVIPSLVECGTYSEKHPGTVETSFGVRPGYTVAVRLSRGPVVSGVQEYVGSVGFMNFRWQLERVS